tara:strand:+ start:263 stop:370 length:108 start_codon:yes stop_codon:yes gene_type:complete
MSKKCTRCKGSGTILSIVDTKMFCNVCGGSGKVKK